DVEIDVDHQGAWRMGCVGIVSHSDSPVVSTKVQGCFCVFLPLTELLPPSREPVFPAELGQDLEVPQTAQRPSDGHSSKECSRSTVDQLGQLGGRLLLLTREDVAVL